jgi:hypothetical protein
MKVKLLVYNAVGSSSVHELSLLSFAYFCKNREMRFVISPCYLIVRSSMCASLMSFEPNGRYSRKSALSSCHRRWPRCRNFSSHTLNRSKMVTFINLRWVYNLHQWTWVHESLGFGYHRNHTILVWHLNWHLSLSWAHCLSAVTMEIKVYSSL